LKHSNLGQSEVGQPAVAILAQQIVAWFYVSANFALASHYRLSLLMFVVKNINLYPTNSDSHNADTVGGHKASPRVALFCGCWFITQLNITIQM
jgi:hypothetical protein